MRARLQSLLLSLQEARTRMLIAIGFLVFWFAAVYWTSHTDITVQMANRFTTDQSGWHWNMRSQVSFEDRDFNLFMQKVLAVLQSEMQEPKAKSEPEVYRF